MALFILWFHLLRARAPAAAATSENWQTRTSNFHLSQGCTSLYHITHVMLQGHGNEPGARLAVFRP